jgi:DNA-binding NarL/FixJ family response regulator
MQKFNKLFVITEREPLQHLTLLAQSVGIKASQLPKHELLQLDVCHHSLIALPCYGKKLDQRSLVQDIRYLQQKAPVFLCQAEKNFTDLPQALQLGLRGVIYRDDAMDKVMTALQVLFQGQLYYPRAVLSAVVDDLFVQSAQQPEDKLQLQHAALLTRQERKIIQLVAEGARNKEIADSLNISAHTVKAHLSTIFRKTQARNRVELLRWYQQSGQQPLQLAFARLA